MSAILSITNPVLKEEEEEEEEEEFLCENCGISMGTDCGSCSDCIINGFKYGVKVGEDDEDSDDEDSDDEDEQLVCPHCDRNEKECEEQTEEEKNPITKWCGWGLSCDDCYYKNHPDSDDEDSDDEDSDDEDSDDESDGEIHYHCRDDDCDRELNNGDGLRLCQSCLTNRVEDLTFSDDLKKKFQVELERINPEAYRDTMYRVYNPVEFAIKMYIATGYSCNGGIPPLPAGKSLGDYY